MTSLHHTASETDPVVVDFDFQSPVSSASGLRSRHSEKVHRGTNTRQTQTANVLTAIVHDASNEYAIGTTSPRIGTGGSQLFQVARVEVLHGYRCLLSNV